MKRMFKQLHSDYLECRTLLHAWDEVSGLALKPHKVEYLKGQRTVFRCTRCGTIREEVWSRTNGELLCRYYTYPNGYSIDATELPEGISLRQAMRLERMARSRQVKRVTA